MRRLSLAVVALVAGSDLATAQNWVPWNQPSLLNEGPRGRREANSNTALPAGLGIFGDLGTAKPATPVSPAVLEGGDRPSISPASPQSISIRTGHGAGTVVIGEDATEAAKHGPYDLIIDGVGGKVLGQALSLLAEDGVCVSYGVSAGADVTFDARAFFRSGRPQLYGLYLFEEFYQHPAWKGLSRLAAMIAAGTLVPHIDHEADWTEIGAVAQNLLDRKITGPVHYRELELK